MPKLTSATVTLRLSSPDVAALDSRRQPGEARGTAARRILREALHRRLAVSDAPTDGGTVER